MRFPIFFAIAAGALMACGSVPIDESLISDAARSIDFATESGAVEHAPLELRFAREKLAGARLAVQQRDEALANRLAAESLVNSELALAKCAASKARDASRELRESNEQLRQELNSSAGGSL